MGKKKKKKHKKKKKLMKIVNKNEFITPDVLKEIKEPKKEERENEILKEQKSFTTESGNQKTEIKFFKSDLVRILITIIICLSILVVLGYLIWQRNLFDLLWRIKIW